jgi:hypothetical protein
MVHAPSFTFVISKNLKFQNASTDQLSAPTGVISLFFFHVGERKRRRGI